MGVTMDRTGVTIAEALQRAGCNTSMFGKWHLSVMDPLQDEEKHQAWLNHQYEPARPFTPARRNLPSTTVGTETAGTTSARSSFVDKWNQACMTNRT